MGEIKSTLEIIMEKTKHMTISEDEKVEFKLREIRDRVRGLITKFLDGVIGLDRFKIELVAIDKDKRDLVTHAVMGESISRITLGGDNAPILNILGVVNGIDMAPIKELLTDFNHRLKSKRVEIEEDMLERLKKRGISGSGVIPNLDADPEWIHYFSERNNELEEKLRLLCR